MNYFAQAYLPHNFTEYIIQGHFYRLVEKKFEIDTGDIENNILAELPNGIKRGFCLAKYLSQLCLYDKEDIVFFSVYR